ncbi:hypothetical protein AB4Y45_38525 [Paraburkholderia sp. EG287A]|uniref:hypothetical protein n=1 Tax=unclassified Paraburkholderia TaxID=2615204 RepID=UPI0034D2D8DC
MTIRLKAGAAIAAMAIAGSVLAQTADTRPVRIRGSIVSLDGDVLKVHRRSGDTVSIALETNVPVSSVKAMQLSDIKPGTFVGTAATTGTDGKLTATEVVVFPEAARGTGEGHYAWDLGPNSTMTNANVDTVVQGTEGRNLKLSYKGGSNEITVPPNVPIVTFMPAARSDLAPGKQVFVVAKPASQGTYAAQRLVVEKNGVVPPM